MPAKLLHGPHRRRTHPLVWCAAIICTIISVAVIIAGIVVFVSYLVIHPRVPFISVVNANLDLLRYDYTGVLETQLTIVVRAENDNLKAHATFSDTKFRLSFDGVDIAELVASTFDVEKNKSVDFNYVVQSSPIPLGEDQMKEVDMSLKEDRISFDLKGSSRTQWRVWLIGSVKFWCHLSCSLHFHTSNHTYIYSRCSSRAK